MDTRVIDGNGAGLATPIEAIFVRVVVDVDLIQKIDCEPSEYLDLALQLESGKFVTGENFPLHIMVRT